MPLFVGASESYDTDAWEAYNLKKENEKLRKLVLSAVGCITDAPDCDSCALGEQVSGAWVCHIIGAAKELGVEVD